MLIGAHVDANSAIAQAVALGADIAQVTLCDPQSWKKPAIPGDGATSLGAQAADAGVGLYVHAAYVINVASTNNRIRIPSRKLLQQTIDAAAGIGARGVIVHGGHVTADEEQQQGYDNWRKCVDGLDVKPDGVYVDVTFGGGGHSREILSRLGSEGRLFSFDQDADAEQNVPSDESRLTFVRSNFRYLTHWMRYHGQTEGVDGILADLGVSSHHFDAEERGFSFRFDAPLDMRMNGRGGETAAQVLNTRSEDDLAKIFQLYGELKNGRRLAAAIVARRQEQAYSDIDDLLQVVKPMMPRDREKKDLARVFQALRIEVNHEMEALEEMLRGALRCLKPGGRLSVLTYHSLEDRMVKNFMRSGNVEGKVEQDFFGNRLSPLRPINNKVIVPSPEEQSTNPRSRSAKLRIAEKVTEKKP